MVSGIWDDDFLQAASEDGVWDEQFLEEAQGFDLASDEDLEEWEKAFEDCGMFVKDGVIRCFAIGSEECDCACPFRELIGQPAAVLDVDQDEFEAVDKPSTPSTIDPFDDDDIPF